MVAGMFAGLVNSFVLSPIELVKCRLQLQTEKNPYYKGTVDCVTKILREEGISNGLMKGLVPTITREVPCYMAQFSAYEGTKFSLLKLRKWYNPKSDDSLKMTDLLVSGGVAGWFCWLCSYPQDIIKTKLQTQFSNNRDVNRVEFPKY